jgi:TPR repeat protein
MARLSGGLLFLFVLQSFLPAGAAGIDDADERLFQAQLALAQKGDPRAEYFLGEMHEHGLGTKQNAEEAFKWYTKAAESGDVLAKRKLSMRKEIETEIKTEQAVEPASPPPPPPAVAEKKRNTPPSAAVTASARDTRAAEAEAKRQQAIQAERDKRRAAVRAMILDRIRHPIGDPFE